MDADLCANAMAQVAYWNLLFRGWDERDEFTGRLALTEP